LWQGHRHTSKVWLNVACDKPMLSVVIIGKKIELSR
jgi:hypothetical protein